jgi:hypothetical protein
VSEKRYPVERLSAGVFFSVEMGKFVKRIWKGSLGMNWPTSSTVTF